MKMLKIQKLQKILEINGKVYHMGLQTAESVLETVRDSVKESNCIFALEKQGRIEMHKDKFFDKKAFNKAVAQYVSHGFKVHYTTVV